MNPEIKQRWIDALRSGEYNQDKHSLKTPKGFCCLGVLTDLYLKEKNKDWEFPGSGIYKFKGHEGSLHNEVIDWCDFPSGGREESLAYMNDVKEKTFQEIADYIEKYL